MLTTGVTDNNEEILDIVDENDIVIGQSTKRQVHDGKNILHREIAVIIHDNSNNLLLQQRSLKKTYFPGKWSITAAGHVLSGQIPEEAAHMELKEELGFDVALAFVEKRKYTTGDHVSLGFLFIGEFPKGVKIVPDKNELEKAEFFTPKEITKMIEDDLMEPHSVETITKYFTGEYNTHI